MIAAAIRFGALPALLIPWCASLAADVNSQPGSPATAPDSGTENRLIVKYRRGVDRMKPRVLASGVTLTPVRDLDLIGACLVTIPDGSLPRVLAILADDPEVEYAEPDRPVEAYRYPNDPSFPLLWGLNNSGQTGGLADADIDATEAWDLATGDSIIVGVIDSGVDTAHVDLRGNIWTNAGEIPGNGVDDDDNGFVDDVHGWDFLNWDNDPFDDNSHGTHVAGTIAARGDNGIGVTGVSWSARIMPLKFLRADGFGSTTHAILALSYAVRMGAKLTCNSWGGTGYSQALRDAIDSAGAAGLLFVAASGNVRTNLDIQPHYPAAYDLDCIIAVSASDHLDRLASEPSWGSNWGPTRVDLAAPGVNVYSTIPGGAYDFKSGTSMAAPHVAGAAALLWSEYPWLSARQVKTRLLATVDQKAELRGKNVSGGRLNLHRAMQAYDQVAPAAIVDLQVVKAEGSRVTLHWTAPGDDSASGRASRYDLRYAAFPVDSASFAQAAPVDLPYAPAPAGTAETATVRDLDFDTDYYFAIRSEDEWFNLSPLSGTAGARTLGPPRLVVAPDLFVDTLRAGEAVTHPLYLVNFGVGELLYGARAEFPSYVPWDDTAGGDDADPPERAAGPRNSTPASETAGSGKSVILIYADDGALGAAQILAAYPDIERVELWPAGISGGQIPSYADVSEFDAVVAWNNRIWADPFAIGGLLATCVDSGIAVVTAVDCWGTNQFVSRGRYFDSAGYSPFRAVGPALFTVRTLGSYNTVHPIMEGVSSLAIGSYHNDVVLTPGAREVALWDDGTPLVATNPHTVAINVWPGDGYHWIGDFPELLHNAIRYAAGDDFWLDVTAGPGEILAADSKQLAVKLDATRLLGGQHEGSIVLSTNDPAAPELTVPVHLLVLGTARLELSASSIDFGAVFVGYEQTLPLKLANAGTGTLDVTPAVGPSSDFSVTPSRILLAPRRDTMLTVTFRPQGVGPVKGELALTSNDSASASTVVTLTGLGAPAPSVGLAPASFSAELFTGGGSTQTLSVTNSGTGSLDFQISVKGRRPPSLEASSADDRGGGATTGPETALTDTVEVLLWNLYGDDSPGGEVGKTEIALQEAHPTARITRSDKSDPVVLEHLLEDRQVMIIPEQENALPDLLTKAVSWRRVLSDFVFTGGTLIFCQEWGNSAGLAAATGLLDVTPVDRGSALPLEIAQVGHSLLDGVSDSLVGTNLTAWYTVNSPDAQAVVVEPLSDKAVVVDRPWGAGHVVLLGFDYFTHNADMSRILANAVRFSRSGLSWIDAVPGKGTVPAGAALAIDVRLRASMLAGGDYEADLVVSTSDPEKSRLFVPAFLHVTDAPHLVVDKERLQYGEVFLGQSAVDTLRIVNTGTLPLDIHSVLTDHPAFSAEAGSFTLLPAESRHIAIAFTPATPGSASAAVVIATNDPDEPEVAVPLAGEGVIPPSLAISPYDLSSDLPTGGRQTTTLVVSNQGGSALKFSVRARLADEPAGASLSLAWRPRAGLPEPRSEHSLVAHPDGKIYTVGGFADGVGMFATLRIYDPKLDLWTSGAARPAADRGMPAALGADGKIYTFSSVAALSASYDPAMDAWTPIPAPPIDLVREAAAAPGPDGLIYLFGGEGGGANDPLACVQIFDPQTRSWSIGTPMPTARYQHEAVTGQNGRIYVLGGRTAFAAAPLDVMEIYDPGTDSWETGPPMPTAKSHFAAMLDLDGRISVLGGKPGYLHNEAPYFATADAYDPRDCTWSPLPPLPFEFGECAAARLGRDVYVVGGSNGTELRSVFALHTPRWLSVYPDSGTVTAGGTLALEVAFDATGVASGVEQGILEFTTNDPQNARLERPVALSVSAAPDLALFVDSLDFGLVYVGLAVERRIRIANAGFAPLTATSITTGSGEFSVDPPSVVIAPGDAVELAVTFAPDGEGPKQAMLYVVSNDPDLDTARVVVAGSGSGAPELTLEPARFDLDLQAGEAQTWPLVIGNTGTSPLTWNLPELSPFSTAQRGPRATAAGEAGGLNHLGGLRIGFMEIPGTDPYTTIKSDLESRGALVVDVPFPFLPAMLHELDVLAVDFWFTRATAEGIDSVRAWLAQGHGLLVQASTSIYDLRLTQLLNGTGITLYRSEDVTPVLSRIVPHATTQGVDSVEASGERAFCTAAEPALPTVLDDRGRIHAAVTVVGSGRLCVVGNRLCTNANLDGQDTRPFANRIFDWLASGTPVEADPIEGIVEPGAAQTVILRFDAGALIAGAHEPQVVLRSDDPARHLATVPVHLNVTGRPAIELSSDTLTFDTSFVGYGAARVLEVFNRGTEALNVSVASSDAASFAAAPSSFAVPVFGVRDIQVTFLPADTGMLSAVLTVASDAPQSPVVSVQLSGQAILPPKIRLSFDSLELDLRVGELHRSILSVENLGATRLTVEFDAERADETNLATSGQGAPDPPALSRTEEPAVRTPEADSLAYALLTARREEKLAGVGAPGIPAVGAAAPQAEYRGKYLTFGITARGELWPFAYPGDTSQTYSSGYLVAYRAAGADHVKAVWYGLGTVVATGFQEIVNDSQAVQAEFRGMTNDGLLEVVRRFTFERNYKYVTVETELINRAQVDMDDVVLKTFADFDVDVTYADDDWDYDRARHMVVAQDRRFVGLAGKRAPDFMDIEGRDDAGRRETYVNFPTGPVVNYDGVALLHFERGRLKPGQSTRVMVTTAVGDSKADLDGQVERGLQRVKWLALDSTHVTVSPQSQFALGVALDASQLNGGDYQARILFASNDPAAPEIRVPVHLHVTGVPALSLESDTLDFGVVYLGYPVTVALAVTNRGTDLLLVNAIESDLADVAMDVSSFALSPGFDTALMLTFTPETVGPVEGTLTLRSNDSVTSERLVTMRATVALPPAFALSPDSIALVLPEGDSEAVDITISNGGPGTLFWSVPELLDSGASVAEARGDGSAAVAIRHAPSSSGQAGAVPAPALFSLSPASGTLAPATAQDATLVVRTAGLTAGAHRADLTFAHNDPANPPAAIAVYIDLFAVRRGDANADRTIDARDIIYLVKTLWGEGPDPYGTAGDLNCDGAVTLTDIIILINYVFKSGAAPGC